jgi:D-alanyl-D-alanine carboxypeptidase (penicillin-binding protein 5/6)
MTKLMTLLLIMEAVESERISMNDQVLITPNAARMGGSQVFLEACSRMRAEDLVKAIAIASANDASVAMAEFISGTNDIFVAKMNERCTQLGCENTNFVNTHGLDHAEHFSSAADMALISRELIRHEAILGFTSIYEEHLNKPDGNSTWMVNTNRLIRFYQGMDGLKTGFTSRAGYCLASTAVRNNMRLISVVMNSPTPNDRTSDTVELLNYGFSNYKVKTILDTNHNLGTIEIINGKSKTANLRLLNAATELENINEERKYTYNIIVKEIKAPVNVGDIVGELEVIENNEVISRHPITVMESVQRANLWDLYRRNLQMFFIGR